MFIPCAPDKITFTVAPDRKSITFYPCGRTSYNANDIDQNYCPFCHRFMDLVETARQLNKEMRGAEPRH